MCARASGVALIPSPKKGESHQNHPLGFGESHERTCVDLGMEEYSPSCVTYHGNVTGYWNTSLVEKF